MILHPKTVGKCYGLVKGGFNLTMLVVLIDTVAGGNLFLTLLVTGIAALMLGKGMPTLPAYLTIVLILGPAMQNLGLTVLAAHLFVPSQKWLCVHEPVQLLLKFVDVEIERSHATLIGDFAIGRDGIKPIRPGLIFVLGVVIHPV